jgi:DtxR family manganese transport transcriptional regulator
VDSDLTKQAHARTRKDHAQELAEDYVEAIADVRKQAEVCRATDLADRFGVSKVTVNRAIGRLKRAGLVNTRPYGPVWLTAKGRVLARVARKRHETVLQFLTALGVSPQTAALDSEGLEHHVSPETIAAMRAFIQRAQDS